MAWRVPGYESLTQLGRGSTGVVMSARDIATGTVVAIKYLSADVYKGEFVQRYRDEVSALDRIEHPHVAQVFEYVEHGGSAAVITELVSGVSLREVLDTCGALDPQACLYVVKGALLGLGEAHGRGIVHRDVKPENLIVDGAGIVKVVDIGIPAPHRRAPGTPRYLAPELWAGRPANDAVAAIRPGELPERLRTLLLRGLAEQPTLRPADADALLDELEMAALTVYGPDWEAAGKQILARQMASPKSRGRRAAVP